jgi:hypothetical protein
VEIIMKKSIEERMKESINCQKYKINKEGRKKERRMKQRIEQERKEKGSRGK